MCGTEKKFSMCFLSDSILHDYVLADEEWFKTNITLKFSFIFLMYDKSNVNTKPANSKISNRTGFDMRFQQQLSINVEEITITPSEYNEAM